MNNQNIVQFRRRENSMVAQIQATPTLRGKDAELLIRDAERKPTQREIEKMEERRKFFGKIGKRGLK